MTKVRCVHEKSCRRRVSPTKSELEVVPTALQQARAMEEKEVIGVNSFSVEKKIYELTRNLVRRAFAIMNWE